MLTTVLLVLALVLFSVEAIRSKSLVAGGLAAWVLSVILATRAL